jgi:murein DD-endopeptidase MepM/ murein hydrolase activator NlpD
MYPLRLLVLLALFAPFPAAGAEEPVPAPGPTRALDVSVRARELAPGELVRVDVRAEEPLERVTGTLRGEALDFVAACEEAGPCGTWSAWAALDLDWKPGRLEAAVTASGASGATLRGARTLELQAKSFPTSELKVDKKYVDPPAAEAARIARDNAKLGKVYARRTPMPPPQDAWVRPVPGEPTGVFGSRRVFNGQKRKPHAGLDLRAPEGTPVKSAGPGTVALAEDLYFSGNTVIVDHGGGLFLVYAHLSRIGVKAGERVEAGTQLGLSGATGRVTGPHLHWGGKVGPRIFDPTSLLDPAFGG